MSNTTDKIDWKRKLTSRKFWVSIATFVTMILIFFNVDKGTSEQVAALIMAGATIIGYVVGEGLADGLNKVRNEMDPMTTIEEILQAAKKKEDK